MYRSPFESVYGTNSGMTPLECQGAVEQYHYNQFVAANPPPWKFTILNKQGRELGSTWFNGTCSGAAMQWAKTYGGNWYEYEVVAVTGPESPLRKRN